MGRIVLAKGGPKREIRDGAVEWEHYIFNEQTFTFDYCTYMIGWHSVGAVFLDLYCKRVLQLRETPELGSRAFAQSN